MDKKVENLSLSKLQALELFKENLNQDLKLCGFNEAANLDQTTLDILLGKIKNGLKL